MKKSDVLERVYKSDLPSRAKQIMFYLINRANAEGTCFPSNNTIASDCGISTRTVQRTMNVLLEKEFIKRDSRFREQGGQTSNLYTLQLEWDDDKNDKKEVEAKENTKAEKANDSMEEIQAQVEKIEAVTFSDYQQDEGVSETEGKIGHEDLSSLSTKENHVGEVIEKTNIQNTETIKDDNLSNWLRCHPIFNPFNKKQHFEKHDQKSRDFPCHGDGDILYPP